MQERGRISTGSLILDTAMGGGWPAGAFVHLFVGPDEHASDLYAPAMVNVIGSDDGLLVSTSLPDLSPFGDANRGLLILFEADADRILYALERAEDSGPRYTALVVDALEQVHVVADDKDPIACWFARWRFYEKLSASHTGPGVNVIVRHKYVTSGAPNRFMVEYFVDYRNRTRDSMTVAVGHQGCVDAVVSIPLLAGEIDTRLELHRLTGVSPQKLRRASNDVVSMLAYDYWVTLGET